MIHKVRGGQGVEDAVEDIVRRGVSELRKNAFGDDLEDVKALPWTREQAWAVLRALSSASEVGFACFVEVKRESTERLTFRSWSCLSDPVSRCAGEFPVQRG